MGSELKALFELQQIDTQIERIEQARAGLDSGEALRAEVEQLSSQLQQQLARLHELDTDYQDQDLKLKGIEAKRQQHRNKLFSGTITNPKELESFRQEIEMLTRNKGTVEEALLGLMDEIEAQKQAVAKLEENLKAEQHRLDTHVLDYNERLERLDAQLAELSAQRATSVGSIDEPFLRRYEGLRKKAGNVAVVKIEGSVCRGCGVSLTSFAFRRLREGEQNVTCENCGRLLYYEE